MKRCVTPMVRESFESKHVAMTFGFSSEPM